MNNRIADYTFTIIEDGQVPLAGDFSTASNAPVVAVVAIALLVLTAVAYVAWLYSHLRRVETLKGEGKIAISNYLFHPVELIRMETELEYKLVSEIG